MGILVPTFFSQPSPYAQPTSYTNASSFTYLVTPQLKISPDLMLYARIATGYRLGGANENPGNVPGVAPVPPSFKPDTTDNYELGIKTTLLNHALILDGSIYYIDWKDIQITLVNPVTEYLSNGGTARSEGVELSAEVRPAAGLSIKLVGALNDAVLTQNLPATASAIGLSGAQLPYTSHFSGTLLADQRIPLTDAWLGIVGGSVSYVDRRYGEFVGNSFGGGQTPPRFEFPSYTTCSLHAGVEHDRWHINLFVNNATDSRGIIGTLQNSGIGPSNDGGYWASLIQPRTIGLSVKREF